MKQFFKNLTFPRAVILVSLLASAGLGYAVYDRFMRLAEVKEELIRVRPVVREIREKSIMLTELQRAAAKEGFKGQESAEYYIRSVAKQDNVAVGDVAITPREVTPFKGYVDVRYQIKPAHKDQAYVRTSVGNFLYKLEADSRRVKVTSLKMSPLSRIRPGEVGDDRWTFEAELTSRQAADS
jgi:hypothetical protein